MRFRNLPGTDLRRQETTDALVAAADDPIRSQTFVERFGQNIVISDDGVIEGRQAQFSIPRTRDNDGTRNHGIFRYAGVHGPQILKLISEIPDRRIARQISVGHLIDDLEGAILGETSDAPKIYRFGTATYQGKIFYFVDMEDAFHGMRTQTLKSSLRGGAGNWVVKEQSLPAILKSMAIHFLDAYNNQICPSDPDFIISEQGDVRWIDPFQWKARLWKTTNAPNADRGKNGTSFTNFMDYFSQSNADLAGQFLQTFLRELKAYNKMTSFEKRLLLEDMFSAQHHGETATEKQLRAYMQRVGVTSENQFEPLPGILRIYDALP